MLGIGLGAGIGSWLAGGSKPSAEVALSPREAPYEVPVHAYRPPVREALRTAPQRQKSTATKELKRPSDSDAEENAQPERTAPKPRRGAPELALSPPHIGSSKTPAWLANAAAMPAVNGRPMIALVIDDLGLSQRKARRTIALPAPLTLAFLPYAHNLPALADAGRRAGHELLVHVNMEPKDHDVDPGQNALLTSLGDDELRRRLEWALGRFDGYIGINNHMGSRFTEWPEGMEIVIETLKRRGLLYLDSVTSDKSVGPALARAHGEPYASRDVFLDHDRHPDSIARQLRQTERIARRRGYAIAIGHPYDVTFEALQHWLPDVVRRGFVMVPLSAIVRHQRGEG